jgi:fluoroquinolone transport system permease protein
MPSLKLVRGLAPLDARSVGRDSLLRWMIVLPIIVAVPCRLVLPLVLGRTAALFGADALAYYPAIASGALLLIAPIMAGTVIGFLLLDQRDDRTLMALQVTPMPLNAYLAYRLAAPMLISLVMTVAAFVVGGLASYGVAAILVGALAAAPLAPLVALGLAAYTANKVQGLALMKAATVFLIAPLAALFVPGAWHWAFGVAPTFWPVWLLWALRDGDPAAAAYLLGGVLYDAALLVALVRRFNRMMVE